MLCGNIMNHIIKYFYSGNYNQEITLPATKTATVPPIVCLRSPEALKLVLRSRSSSKRLPICHYIIVIVTMHNSARNYVTAVLSL